MLYKYDICIIDYFPKNWLCKLNKNTKCLDILKQGKRNIKKMKHFPMGHGIAQYDILLNINPEAKICIVPITPEIKMNQINIILHDLIKLKTSRIINISFGFYKTAKNKNVTEMKKNCLRAAKKGILIVCAKSNDMNLYYPSEFNSVIKVSSSTEVNSDIIINDWKAIVKFTSFYLKWSDDRKLWVNGNSYYTPIISGLLSKKKIKLNEFHKIKKEYFFKDIMNNILYLYK